MKATKGIPIDICKEYGLQVMHKRLYSFLEKNNVLYKVHQYGFRKSWSTMYAVSKVVKDTLISLE